jgi:hypothetical protein
MTNDKEERIITFDELRKQPGSIIERQEWWENLPLAPTHTDEEYDILFHSYKEALTRILFHSYKEALTRIKELEANYHALLDSSVDELAMIVKEAMKEARK